LGILSAIFGKVTSDMAKKSSFPKAPASFTSKSKTSTSKKEAKKTVSGSTRPKAKTNLTGEKKAGSRSKSIRIRQEEQMWRQKEEDDMWEAYRLERQQQLDEEIDAAWGQKEGAEQQNTAIRSDIAISIRSLEQYLPPIDSIGHDEWIRSAQIQLTQADNPPIEFYCEVKRIRIYCHSAYLDKLSDLTKFIICSVADGRKKEEIEALTQMGSRAIEEELCALEKGGVLTPNDDSYELTELGKGYAQLIDLFSRYSTGIEAQVNTYSDFVGSRTVCYLESELDPTIACASRRLNYLLLKNDNYSNSLDYVKGLIQNEQLKNVPVLPQVLDTLYTSVKVEQHDERIFERYILANDSTVKKGDSILADTAVASFCIPVKALHYRVQYRALEPYRANRDILLRIFAQHTELLSQEGKLIAERFTDEQRFKALCFNIDSYSGCLLSEHESTEAEVPNGVILLKEKSPAACVDFCKDRLGSIFSLMNEEKQDCFLIKTIPLTSFRLVEKELST